MKNSGRALFAMFIFLGTKELYGSDHVGFPDHFSCNLSKADQDVAKTINISVDLGENAGMTLTKGSFDSFKLSGKDSYRKILEFQSDYGNDSIELDQAIFTTGKSRLILRECGQPDYVERTQTCWTSMYQCQRVDK